MLEIRSLSKRFRGTTAVRDVSFSARPGEIVGCLGPNGAGKSTTVKILIGLLEPTDGEVLWDGRGIFNNLADFQRRIGYIPEEPQLYPHLSGREYLQLAGRLRGIPRAVLEPKIEAFLRLFALWDDADSAVKRPLASIIGRYLGTLYFLAPALSILIAAVTNLTGFFLLFLAGLGTLWLWTRRQRRQGWGDAALSYEDAGEGLLNLGIHG